MATVTVAYEFTDEEILGLLNQAATGCKYWGRMGDLEGSPEWRVVVTEVEERVKHILTREEFLEGIRIFATKYPKGFSDLLTGRADMNTGDAILQCALFGKLVYG